MATVGSRPAPVYSDVFGAVGRTPLVRLNRVTRGLRSTVLGKCEFMNPSGSVKDRIGLAMIEDAERSGALAPGGTIVEATSGNTGLALASIGAARGYRSVFTMPDKMSREKVRLLEGLGAEVVVTPTVEPGHPDYYGTVAQRIAKERPGAWFADQFHNPSNPAAHERTTGPEVWEQTGGRVDAFVAGMGTGGTITGVSRHLKSRRRDVRIVGADPEGSTYCSVIVRGRPAERTWAYKTEGIGGSCVPATLDPTVVDHCHTVSDREALLAARWLARTEGIYCGGSTGTALVAALREATTMPAGSTIVVVLADPGERYLSKCYDDAWMESMGYGTGLPDVARELGW
jgi:cystathionine beta-synthase